jgi:CubicO group peptidase (beta-lactamase class C family)
MAWRHPIIRVFSMWAAAFVCLSLAARVIAQEGLREVPGRARQERMREIFAVFDGDRPGVAVGVFRNGTVLYAAGHGLADLDRKVPIDPDTAFHIASIGKQMTAACILMLVEEGKVRLDAPASRYLKEMRGWAGAVTVRDLLQHTAGIPDAYPEMEEEEGKVPTGTDELRRLARGKRLEFEPGSQFQYSDSGYDILGVLIERVSHQSYPRFLEERILRPAGMTASFVYDKARLGQSRRALGYERGFGYWKLNDDSPLNLLYGSGEVYSTVHDLARYDHTLFGSHLLRPASMAELLKPAVLEDGTVVPYGFGWRVDKDESGEAFYAHSGNWLGFSAYYLHYPKDGLAVVILANSAEVDAEALAFESAALFRSQAAPPPAR